MSSSSSSAPEPFFGRVDKPVLIVMAMAAALLSLFLSKAPHIDDPLFLLSAQALLAGRNPFDATINWEGVVQPLFEAALNPSLVPLLLSAVQRVGGGLIAMHFMLMLVAVWGLWGVALLARQCGASPAPAVLLTLLSPAFFLSATNLMCDVPMTAAYTWSLVFLLEAWRRHQVAPASARFFWLGFVLFAVLAYTSKYFALSLVVLAPTVSLICRRAIVETLLFSVLALLLMLVTDIWVSTPHGRSHLLLAMQYAQTTGWSASIIQRVLVAVVFVGLCLLPTVLGLWSFSQRQRLAALVWTFLVVAVVFAQGALGDLRPAGPLMPLMWLHIGVGALVSGVALKLLWNTGFQALTTRAPDAWLLGLWLVGTLFFATVVNWTLAARSVLPMAVPLAVLVARTPLQWRQWAWSLAPLAAVTLVLAHADWVAADTEVEMAVQGAAILQGPNKTPGSRFLAHWGFQQAMEERGLQAYAADTDTLQVGDRLVWPERKFARAYVGKEAFAVQAPLRFKTSAWATTINKVGFYSLFYGPLPFLVGDGLEQRLWWAEIQKKVTPCRCVVPD